MTFDWNRYCKNVEILRNNKEKVDPKLLKTKYAAPYKKLLNILKAETEEMIKNATFSGMPFADDLKMEDPLVQTFVKTANEILHDKNNDGVNKEVSRAVFKEYNPDKALEIIYEKVVPDIYYKAYAPYWLKHCRIVTGEKKIWNDLIDMSWDEKLGVWVSDDGMSFRGILPPTQELIDKEMKEQWQSKESQAN